jgi:hypothetical protein
MQQAMQKLLTGRVTEFWRGGAAPPRGLRGRVRMRTDNGQGTMNDNAGPWWADALEGWLTGGNEMRAYHYRRRTR